jgi:hypothetical protein
MIHVLIDFERIRPRSENRIDVSSVEAGVQTIDAVSGVPRPAKRLCTGLPHLIRSRTNERFHRTLRSPIPHQPARPRHPPLHGLLQDLIAARSD